MLPPEQLFQRRAEWIAGAEIKVEDKLSKQLVPFRPNRVQQAIFDRMDAAEEEGRAFFAIGLKSRQHGFSTGVQVEMNRRAHTRRRYHTLSIAHKTTSSTTIFGMTETMRDNMQRDFLVPKKRGNVGRHIELASPIDSKMDVETAGDREAGRSTSRRAVHASEAAFWPDLAQTLSSLRQMVHAAPGAMFVIESTANGIGNAFHDEWVAAQNSESEYEPLFFPWWWDATLRRPAPAAMAGELDAEEAKLAAMGITPEQLAWRRWAIINLCGRSIDTFHQEYPSTWMEAFIASGRLAIQGLEAIVTVAPIRRGNLVGEPYRGNTDRIRFQDDPKGSLRVYQPRRDGHSYVVFVDPMGEPKDDMYEARPERNKQDYACIQVIDLDSAEQVAVWHGRVGEAGLAKEAARIGYVYHGPGEMAALVAPETVGGYGTTTVHVLTQEIAYPNTYRREVYGKATRKPSLAYGWLTSETTRPVMVEAAQDVVRNHPELINDEGTLGEMHTFVVLNGKPQAAIGYHDDRVMALGGALAVRMRADRTIRLGEPRRRRLSESVAQRAPRVGAAA